MKSRIALLNKEAPNIGCYDKFRPILVSYPVVKFMEALILGKLREYEQRGMS